jgi:hypothetical protein
VIIIDVIDKSTVYRSNSIVDLQVSGTRHSSECPIYRETVEFEANMSRLMARSCAERERPSLRETAAATAAFRLRLVGPPTLLIKNILSHLSSSFRRAVNWGRRLYRISRLLDSSLVSCLWRRCQEDDGGDSQLQNLFVCWRLRISGFIQQNGCLYL